MNTLGVVFFDKPSGWTSRKAVNVVSRLYGRIKAGHTGTLDPLATGMLPILLGDATRFAGMGLDADKTYRVAIDFSIQTDSLDTDGSLLERFDHCPSLADIEAVLPQFIGPIEQVPPAFSAIRVQGKRAYDLARQGQEVVLAGRSVCIHSLKILAWTEPVLCLEVSCSKGSYIRSLARDLGIALHVGGCVQSLRRLSLGSYDASLMSSIEAIEEDAQAMIQPIDLWLQHLEVIVLAKSEAIRFVQGQRLPCTQEPSDAAFRVYHDDALLGLAHIKQGLHAPVLHPYKVLPSMQQKFLP